MTDTVRHLSHNRQNFIFSDKHIKPQVIHVTLL